jgi:hypothetical protein
LYKKTVDFAGVLSTGKAPKLSKNSMNTFLKKLKSFLGMLTGLLDDKTRRENLVALSL